MRWPHAPRPPTEADRANASVGVRVLASLVALVPLIWLALVWPSPVTAGVLLVVAVAGLWRPGREAYAAGNAHLADSRVQRTSQDEATTKDLAAAGLVLVGGIFGAGILIAALGEGAGWMLAPALLAGVLLLPAVFWVRVRLTAAGGAGPEPRRAWAGVLAALGAAVTVAAAVATLAGVLELASALRVVILTMVMLAVFALLQTRLRNRLA